MRGHYSSVIGLGARIFRAKKIGHGQGAESYVSLLAKLRKEAHDGD